MAPESLVAAFQSANGTTILNGRLGPISTGHNWARTMSYRVLKGHMAARIRHPMTVIHSTRLNKLATPPRYR